MAEICRIQLNTRGYLDVEDNSPVPLNYAISDIRDISKRSGGYSKSIILSDTANNHELMGYLFDVNIADSSFNKNIKEKCIILKNGVPQINGFLQLKKVIKESKANSNGNYKVKYEVAVKEDLGNFFNELNDTLIKDVVDLSQYDHYLEWSAITATSAYTYENVYKYHQYLPSAPAYGLKDFRPGIFSKVYWDYIFSAIGYTYEWTGESYDDFKRTIHPYDGDLPQESAELNNLKKFRAGFSGATQYFDLTNTFSSVISMTYDDETSRDFFDSGNTYASGIYTGNYYGNATFKTKFQYELFLSAVTSMTAYTNNPGNFNIIGTHGVKYSSYHGMQWIGQFNSPSVTVNQFSVISTGVGSNDELSSGLNYITSGVTAENMFAPPINGWVNDAIFPGFQCKPILMGGAQNIGYGVTWKDASGNTQPAPRLVMRLRGNMSGDTDNYFFNEPVASQVGQGSVVVMNDYIDKKIKIKDYIKDIITIYHLYITYDPNRENHLIIKSRDDFYDSGAEHDITDRLAVEREHTIEFLPDLQSKKILFTYKDGAKDLAQTYKDTVGEIYGQYEYTFENEFVRDLMTIGPTQIEPTVIAFNNYGNPVSGIYGNAPKTGMRILYDCGWIEGNSWNVIYKTGGGSTGITQSFTTYPAALHLYPDPINPEYSLEFGLCDYYFYNNWVNLTNNNLYNRYYKRFISQIETGKLFTGWFKLDEQFINTLDLRDRFYIKDNWYNINRIIDYNANAEGGLTQCEFISVDEGTTFNAFRVFGNLKPSEAEISGNNTFGPADDPGPGDNVVVGPAVGVDIKGDGNTVVGGTGGGTGRPTLGAIFGSKNNVGGSGGGTRMMIMGTGNTAGGESIFFVGNDNYLFPNVDKSFIIGDNNTGKTANIIAIGVDNAKLESSDVIYLGRSVVQFVNFISAGRNEVLNPFPDSGKLVNYVNAGRNAVRSLGTQSPESAISAGRDEV